jgi:ankyrin repeat protein
VSHPKTINIKQYETPLHMAARKGHNDVAKVLLEAGASLSTVGKDVIETSVKLRQSNIKPFK